MSSHEWPDESNHADDRLFARERAELAPTTVVERLEAAIDREYAKPSSEQRAHLIAKWRRELVNYGMRTERPRTKHD